MLNCRNFIKAAAGIFFDEKSIAFGFFLLYVQSRFFIIYISFIIIKKNQIMNKKNVEKELQLFMERPEFRAECQFLQNQSVEIYRQLLEAEAIPDAEVIKRFSYAKPLVRLRKRIQAYGTSMEPECIDSRCKVMGGSKEDDLLAWAITGNLNENFVKEFGQSIVFNYGDGILSVGKLKVLTRFTVYSVPYLLADGDRMVSVSAAEVLRQLPSAVSPDEQYAFELRGVADYDDVLQRFPVQIMLYRVLDGYAPDIAKIKAKCRPAVLDIF